MSEIIPILELVSEEDRSCSGCYFHEKEIDCTKSDSNSCCEKLIWKEVTK